NFAQGPFQGYVPDLVPAAQVGLASGLMGVMIVLGRIGGVAIGSIGLFTGSFVAATIGLGLLELTTAIVTVVTVDEGRAAVSREGRSWLQIATGAWGLDILKERSFVWLLGSRLFVLMATVTLTDLIFFYMSRSIGLSDTELAIWINVATAVIAVPTAIAIGGVAMDRVGAFDFSLGPRVAFLFALLYYALGALLLRPVDERRRDH